MARTAQTQHLAPPDRLHGRVLLPLLFAHALAGEALPGDSVPGEALPGDSRPGDALPGDLSPAPAPAALPDDPLALTPPVLLEFVTAPYPAEAEASRIEGTVHLLLAVDVTGAVTRVEVLSPAGHGFDEAAVAAASTFRFTPAQDPSGPVAVELEFAYGFTLSAPVQLGVDPAASDAAAEQAPVTLEGVVKEMATFTPVWDANVRALRDGVVVGEATSDLVGHFEMRGVDPGQVQIVARRPGYQDGDLELEVTPGEVTHAIVWVRNLGYGDGLIATYDRVRDPEVTRRTLSIREVRQVPGTFGDPVRVIQSLPGAARPPFSSGLLVLRGANPEDSNVYVDGVEVPLIYHLGGFRSILNPNFIESVDYLPGTYGTQYGRSTGGVVDVRSQTRYPDRPQTTWRTDFLDSGAYFQGKVGKKIGVAAGVRKSYLDLLLKPLLGDSEVYVAPRWFDYQAKVQLLDAGADEASAFLFGFQDDLIVRLGEGSEDQLGVHYSSHRLVLRYAHPLSEALKVEVRPAFGIDGTRAGFGSLFTFEISRLLVDLRADLAWKASPALGVKLGLDGEAVRQGFSIAVGSVPVEGDDLSETEPFVTEEGSWQFTPDPFVEATLRPFADRDRAVIVVGSRLDLLARTDTKVLAALDPRLAGRFGIVKGGTLKAGTGLYNQPPQGIDLGFGDALGYERAWASEIGWEQKIGPALSADVTGFYRWMDQLSVGSTATDLTSLGDDVPTGVGRAYGLEVMVRYPLTDRLFGWVAYTLSHSERNDAPHDTVEDGAGWYDYEYDQTHILTAVAGYRLPLDFQFSGRFQYVTGNPYTPYDGGLFEMDSGAYYPFPSSDTNSVRTPAYNALDLRIEKLFTFTHWQFSGFADFLNVYNQKNPEFIQYNYDYTEHTYITGLPFIPSLGFEATVNL